MDIDSTISTKSNARKLPQYIGALAACGAALASGIVLGWTSPAGPVLTSHKEYAFEISEEQLSWIGSAMTLGAAIICIPTGFMINWFGRKWSLLLLTVPFTIGWALVIWAQNVSMMYIGRFILGLANGGCCVIAPMYIGEIADKKVRGSLGSLYQLLATVGTLTVFVLGSITTVFIMSIISGIIPLIFGLIFLCMPETPLHLVSKGKTEKAINSIRWLRGNEYDYNDELTELQQHDEEMRAHQVSLATALGRKATIRALCICFGLMVIQQFCGVNAIVFYTTDIFAAANTGFNEKLATILVGVMQTSATFVSVMVIDKLGRRILLLISASIMAICTFFLGLYFFLQKHNPDKIGSLGWLPVTSLCLYIIVFSLGFGPIPWLMMGELFAPDVKGVAGSMAGSTSWGLAFVVTKTFSTLRNAIGAGQTFWLFTIVSLVGTAFTFFMVPETKGKSLFEIQTLLGDNDSRTEETKLCNRNRK